MSKAIGFKKSIQKPGFSCNESGLFVTKHVVTEKHYLAGEDEIMTFLQNNKTKPEDLYSLHIKTVYNFSYRLSGNEDTAGVLTEKVFLNHRSEQDKLHLLKLTWQTFSKYCGCPDPKGNDPFQQALLTLPPDIRCAVILRDIMGCSYHQISVVLDKSDFETADLISKARAELARSYGKLKIRN